MPLLDQGGVEVLVRTLIEDLHQSNQIFLVSTDTENSLRQAGYLDRISGHLNVPTGILPVDWNETLVKWVKRQCIDVVHFHLSGTYGWKSKSWSNCPITILAKSGVPVVCTNHQAVTFFDRGRPPSPYWRKVAGTIRCWPGKTRQLRSVRWEASVSEHDLALSQKSFPGAGSKLIQIYHSRLDADMDVNTGSRGRGILNVATVAFRKGQHILAEAFSHIAAEYPDWHLDLVGFKAEPACVEAIEAISRNHNLTERIRLHGPHPDPGMFYREAGIYVQPSLLEGLGLSLQEAMFHGVPSIGSDCGGIPELISNPSVGRLFRSGDSSALAEVLASLISDEQLRVSIGRAARLSIAQRGMTRQAMCSNYLKLYQETLQLQ